MIVRKTTMASITQTFDPIRLTERQQEMCDADIDLLSEVDEGDADQDGSIVTALEVIRSMGLTPEQLGELINCLLNGGLPRK